MYRMPGCRQLRRANRARVYLSPLLSSRDRDSATPCQAKNTSAFKLPAGSKIESMLKSLRTCEVLLQSLVGRLFAENRAQAVCKMLGIISHIVGVYGSDIASADRHCSSYWKGCRVCISGSNTAAIDPADDVDVMLVMIKYLHEVRTMTWQVYSPQGGTQPSVPHKLPAGLINRSAAGKRTRDVHSLAVEVCIAEYILVHHLYFFQLFRC